MMRTLTSALVLAIGATQSSSAQETAHFSSESELVVLHVAVRDKRGGYVGGLEQDAFRVSENKQPQTISFFNSQDAPVTVGLLIDSSGSMAPNREMVIAASMAFSKAMNPQDEFFVLGFNEDLHFHCRLMRRSRIRNRFCGSRSFRRSKREGRPPSTTP